jgi:hypothetical protein
MSPLLGSIGAISEYSYRGNLEDYPDPFSFTNETNAEPGTAYTTGITTITGINYKARISISGFGSFSINGGAFTTSSSFIRNNETVSIKIPTTSGTSTDFSKLYSSTLTIGKVSSQWSVTTRALDQTPDSFSFTSVTGMEVGIGTTSNTVNISGLESGIPISSQIISGVGSFSINGATPVFSGNVTNADTIQMALISPVSFASTNTSEIRVGSFITSFSVSTRSADITPDAFSFTDQTNVNFSTAITSNTITISGCDSGVSLSASISGGSGLFRVVRSGVTIRDFSPLNYNLVQNGDQITVRLTSSSSGSTSTSTTLTVSGVSDTFTVTTRSPIVDTIPSQFTFTDVTNQSQSSTITSNTITLSGMTPGENATASVSGGTFRVVRSGSTIRDFSSSSTSVQNGDQITLRTTSSSSASSTVQVAFTVSGTDNTTLPGVSGSTSDTWAVTTSSPNCNPLNANYNLLNVSNASRSTTYNQSFRLNDVDTSCSGFTVSVDGSTAYLVVDGVTGNNLTASYNSNITVYMTSSASYDTTVSTNFRITRGGSTVVLTSWLISTEEAPAPAPNCNPLNSNYNLTAVRDANLSTVYSQSFSLTDVDTSCTGFTVSVDGPTASLIVDGSSGNNLSARYGSSITVRMTSSSNFDETVYTGFYITRGGSTVVNQSWFIVTKES